MSFEHFKTQKYEGAWIPYDGDRTRFRFLVEQFLREALSDSEGTLTVGKTGPEWTGKEKLAGLSYSNTDGWGVVVFSRAHAIGIDLEREDRVLKKNYLELATRFFHETEVVALKQVSVFDGQSAFLNLWMCKEAYSKMKRQHLVDFIQVAVSERANFQPLMKTRMGYLAVVAIEPGVR